MIQDLLNKNIIKEKKIQNSNWLKRPLSEEQVNYAKQDVEYLHDVYYKMSNFFISNESKYKQFTAECSLLENENNYTFNPKQYWQSIKHKFTHKINYEVIKKLFILREKIAYKVNIPREFAIKTSNLLGFIHTGDISLLKTHYKVNKNEFITAYFSAMC